MDNATAFAISIHVPREGHDQKHPGYYPGCVTYFNPRAPRGARPHFPTSGDARNSVFQSTCPARGTTPSAFDFLRYAPYFNPRAPRGARPEYRYSPNRVCGISIHVPREGHDLLPVHVRYVQGDFNPRAPRGARPLTSATLMILPNFNPRAPRGARLVTDLISDLRKIISIHVPREGHDARSNNKSMAVWYFNPRAPRGARRRGTGKTYGAFAISIHVPREGHDSSFQELNPCFTYFNPRAPRGARLNTSGARCKHRRFQSTCPARGTTVFYTN